jgi:hypothetical protein
MEKCFFCSTSDVYPAQENRLWGKYGSQFLGEGNKGQVIIRLEYFQSNDKLLEERQMEDKKGKQGRTKHEVEEIVEFIRLHLYNRGIPCGAQAIQQQMEELNIKPMPSVRTIGRILTRYGLTHGRTGLYPEDSLWDQGKEECQNLHVRSAKNGLTITKTRSNKCM